MTDDHHGHVDSEENTDTRLRDAILLLLALLGPALFAVAYTAL